MKENIPEAGSPLERPNATNPTTPLTELDPYETGLRWRSPWRAALAGILVLALFVGYALFVERTTYSVAVERGWTQTPAVLPASPRVISLKPQIIGTFEEAQGVVTWPVKGPAYIPDGFVLSQLYVMIPDWEVSRQKIMQEIEAGGTRQVPIQAVYRGPAGFSGPWFSLWQGLGRGWRDMEGFPPHARGTVTLSNGTTASWVKGSLRRVGELASRKMAWQDDDIVQFLWQEGKPVQVGSHEENGKWVPDYARLGYELAAKGVVPLEELVKVANSLRLTPEAQ